MKLAIVIPTYQRVNKVKRCVTSILNNNYKNYDIHIVCDNNDIESYNILSDYYKNNNNIYIYLMADHKYVIGIWNWFAKEKI